MAWVWPSPLPSLLIVSLLVACRSVKISSTIWEGFTAVLGCVWVRVRLGIDWVVWGLWVAGEVACGVFSMPSGVDSDVGRGLDAAFLRGIASNSGKRRRRDEGRRTMNSDRRRWVLVAEDDE